jgi:hypothetical protein
MDAQPVGGVGQVTVGFREDALDEPPLELPPAIVEGDAAGHHGIDEAIEELAHAGS